MKNVIKVYHVQLFIALLNFINENSLYLRCLDFLISSLIWGLEFVKALSQDCPHVLNCIKFRLMGHFDSFSEFIIIHIKALAGKGHIKPDRETRERQGCTIGNYYL